MKPQSSILARRASTSTSGGQCPPYMGVRQGVGSAPRTEGRGSDETVRNQANTRLTHDAVRSADPPGNILIATINRLVGDTGVQSHTRALSEGLIAMNRGCSVVTPFTRPMKWAPVFAVRKLITPVNKTWSTRWYRHWHAVALHESLMQHVMRNGASAILAQCPVSAAVALRVREKLRLSFPVSMVCHFNFSEATEYRDKGELCDQRSFQAMLEFERRVMGEVDSVIYVSAWARQIVEQERGIAVRRSSVIWNGIASTVGMKPATRSQLGAGPGDLVFINVGTLEKRKNQLGLIDLFAEIAKEQPNAKLVLVGDGVHRGEIHRRIEEQNLAQKVSMLGTRRDVPALLASADIYIHYAALENCPVVLLEAARAGLPIAAIPSGGVPELLEKLGGFDLDATNSASCLDTLRPLLINPTARRNAGQAAKTAFECHFTREAMVRAYLRALQLLPPRQQEAA